MTQTPTDALRLVPGEPTEAMLNACPASFSPSFAAIWPKVCGDIYRSMLAAAPASPPAYVRTPNEDDRLRRALYRLLERHGAEPDVLSVVGSLWDTLDQGECTDLIEDWLITGKTIQVEGDIDEMLASIPGEAPASPLPGGGNEALIAELKEARGLLERTKPFTSSLAVGASELHSDIRAFLARNGKGEG